MYSQHNTSGNLWCLPVTSSSARQHFCSSPRQTTDTQHRQRLIGVAALRRYHTKYFPVLWHTRWTAIENSPIIRDTSHIFWLTASVGKRKQMLSPPLSWEDSHTQTQRRRHLDAVVRRDTNNRNNFIPPIFSHIKSSLPSLNRSWNRQN